ncbi:MAG: hypothetical protein Q8O01_07890, partial [Candidatus Omnitrophota bacterium]|nr:hypothetical protein [Candidatus Omnitrophota bacterium]
MAQKVAKVGITRKKGYLYYVDKKGNVVETKMARGKSKGGGGKVIAKPGVKKEKGCLYFIDKAGDVSCAKML